MKLKDLNVNNVRLGLKKTNPDLRVPTSNNLAVPSDMKNDESDTSSADQALKTKDIIDTQTISAPSRNTPDIRRSPQIANIPA